MDLLEEWIGPRIHQSLTEALEWKAQGSPASRDGRDVDFEDDGNSLRVKSSKKEFVQITKIENVARPVQLWLSDKWTQLKVIIAAEAAERFECEERRRVTEETLGAVIQIIDYEIVAQHHGPKRTKITMLIKNFQHIGSDGSPLFGAPRPIECLEPIVDLLGKLQTLRAREHRMSQSPASLKPAREFLPSPSQTTSISSVDDNLDRTQAVFATQVPRFQSRKRTREGSLKPNGKQPGVVNGLDSGRSRDTAESEMERQRALGADTAQARNVKVLSSTDNYQQGQSKLLNSISKVAAQTNKHSPTAEQDMIREANVMTSKELKNKKTNDLLSLLAGTKPNKAQQRAADQLSEKPHSSSQEPTNFPAVTLKGISSVNLESQIQPTPVVTESSGQRSKSPRSPVQSLQYPVGTPRVTKPVRNASTAPIDSHHVARQSRKAHARICGREVRIPRNQRDLLDRTDSWYPPEPGHRAPTANVPITILQELNNRAERQASSLQESLQASIASEISRHDRSSQTSSDFEERDNQSSDLDEPIPSAEWPASSPEPNQLPPDSSLDSVRSLPRKASEQDHSTKSDLNITNSKDDSCRLERRQSIISLSSLSDMSQRQYLSRKAKQKSCSADYTTDTSNLQRRNPSRSARPSASKWLSRENSLEVSSDEAEASVTSGKMTSHLPHDHVTSISHQSPNLVTQCDSLENQQIDSDAKLERARVNLLADFQNKTSNLNFHSSLNAENTGNSSASSEMMNLSVVAHNFSKIESSKVSSSEFVSNEEMQIDTRISSQFKTDHSDSDSNSDSNLEISIPRGLNNVNDVPSSFSTQPNKPILQVNRTPDVANNSLKLKDHESAGMLRNSVIEQASIIDLPNPAQSRLIEGISAKENLSSTADQRISTIDESILPSVITSLSSSKAMQTSRLNALKRKASTPITLSSNVTKRRKDPAHESCLVESKTSTRNRVMNWQHRDEFLAVLAASEDASESIHNVFSLDKCLPAQSEDSQVSPQVSTERLLNQQHTSVANQASRISDNSDRMQSDLETQNPQLSTHTTLMETQDKTSTKENVDETRLRQSGDAVSLHSKEKLLNEPGTEASEVESNNPELSLVQVSSTADIPKERSPSPSLPALADATTSRPPKSDIAQERKPIPTLNEEAQQSALKTSAALETFQSASAKVSKFDKIDPTEVDPHPSQEAPSEEAESRSVKKPLSVFDRFKSTYPDYPGNQVQFAAICKRIGLLLRKDRMEHPSLWDDFVIRHRVEYAQYLSQCNDEAEDPISYERFYRSKVSQAKYMSPSGLVVNPDSISEFLPLVNSEHIISEEKKEKETPRHKDGDFHVRRWTSVDQNSSTEPSAIAGRAMDVGDIHFTGELEKPRFQQADRHDRTISSSDSNTICGQTKTSQHKAGSGLVRSESQSTLSSRTSKMKDSSKVFKDRIQKPVIDLTSDLEEHTTSRIVDLSKKQSQVKPSRRPLPWISPSRGKTAGVDHRPDTRSAVLSPSPPALRHRPAVSSVPPKAATQKPTKSVFAEFARTNLGTIEKPVNSPSSISKNTVSISPATQKPPTTKNLLDKKPPKSTDQSGWATDEHSPYRAFVKQYEAITPGKGNSFAKEQDKGTDKRSARKPRPVNPFEFEL